jgi:hypothetical protein
MSKNDPTGKQHYDVTTTSSQKHGKGTEKQDQTGSSSSADFTPKTPSGFLGGLKGVLSDHSLNASDSRSFGTGGAGTSAKTQSSRPGVGGGNAGKPTKNSGATSFGA